MIERFYLTHRWDLTLWVRKDLRVMAINGLEPHHQMQFYVTHRALIVLCTFFLILFLDDQRENFGRYLIFFVGLSLKKNRSNVRWGYIRHVRDFGNMNVSRTLLVA